jgi:hypothetical protein
MLDILFTHVQTWPFWGQAAFLLAIVFGPSVFLIAIVAEVADAIEVRRIRKQGRRWRKW